MNFYAFDFETASYDKHSACSWSLTMQVLIVVFWLAV